MSNYMRDGLLVAAGGLAAILLGALLDETEETTEKTNDIGTQKNITDRPSLDAIVQSVKEDAEAAMAACQTDEEREKVYAQVAEAVNSLQTTLKEKGESIIAALKARETEKAAISTQTEETETSELQSGKTIDLKAETVAEDKPNPHIESLRETAREVASALDEVLASLQPKGI